MTIVTATGSSAVPIPVEGRDTKITGNAAVNKFKGRDITVWGARYVATDDDGYESYRDADIVVAPREECCSLKCAEKVASIIFTHTTALIIGMTVGYVASYHGK